MHIHPDKVYLARTPIDHADAPFETYRENGTMEWQGTYKDGELDGPFESYHENGQLRLGAPTTWVRSAVSGFRTVRPSPPTAVPPA